MLMINGCKCSNADGPVCALVDVSDSAYVVAGLQSLERVMPCVILRIKGASIFMAKDLFLLMILKNSFSSRK